MPEQTLNIPSREFTIDKQLFFTKSTYQGMVTELHDVLKKGGEMEDLTALYGLYYCAFAGLIRSGVLCERENGEDGFPLISVLSDGKKYFIRESVLRSIFDDEYDELVHPWKDTASSYVQGLTDSIEVVMAASADPSDKKAAQKKAEKHDALILDRQKKRFESEKKALSDKYIATIRNKDQKILALNKQLEDASRLIASASTNVQEPAPSTSGQEQMSDNSAASAEVAALRKQIAKMQEDHQKDIETLQKTSMAKLSSVQDELSKNRKEFDTYKADAEAEIEEHKKYVYDPNYDHYYSDVLPKIVDSLEFTHTDMVIRFLCIGLSMTAVLLSLVFVI